MNDADTGTPQPFPASRSPACVFAGTDGLGNFATDATWQIRGKTQAARKYGAPPAGSKAGVLIGHSQFHFAGGEVVTQPDRCVAEVLRVAYQSWKELLEILYRRLSPVLGTETPR